MCHQPPPIAREEDELKSCPKDTHDQIIRASKLEACPFFFWNFKGTPSQEENKTLFSGLKICKMVFSNQIDFPAFFHLQKMTLRNFINSRIRQF
jgi:hypothetical protein